MGVAVHSTTTAEALEQRARAEQMLDRCDKEATVPQSAWQRAWYVHRSTAIRAMVEMYAAGVAAERERAAQIAADAAEGSRALHNLAAKDHDRDGCNIHAEGWRTGQEIATAIRQEPKP